MLWRLGMFLPFALFTGLDPQTPPIVIAILHDRPRADGCHDGAGLFDDINPLHPKPKVDPVKRTRSGRGPLLVCLLALPCCQHEQCFTRLMCASPFDLVETDLHIKWIDIMLMFIADKFFIDHIGIFKFMAILHLQQA